MMGEQYFFASGHQHDHTRGNAWVKAQIAWAADFCPVDMILQGFLAAAAAVAMIVKPLRNLQRPPLEIFGARTQAPGRESLVS